MACLGSMAACQGLDEQGLEGAAPSETAGPTPAQMAAVPALATLKAIDARLVGPVIGAGDPGVTGARVDFQHAASDYLEWTFEAPAAGAYVLGFRYANGDTDSRPLELDVNDRLAHPSLDFPATGSWSSWQVVNQVVELQAGSNRIRAMAIGLGGASIDTLTIGRPDPAAGAAWLAAAAAPSASQLLALTTSCNAASSGKYATDDGRSATVSICKLNGAFFWKADMDIDCDGKKTATCSRSTDPDFQSETAFTTSSGGPLDASTLPYIVVPGPSSKFNYTKQGIKGGQSVAVIYNGRVVYGVVGDEGPSNIIGEASYAMAKALGINSNPRSGGVDSGVTYIVFTGSTGVVSPIESASKAGSVGTARAAQLLGGN